MKVERVYSKGKVSFLDILDPYITSRIEELANYSNNQRATSTLQRPNKGDELI